MGGASDFSVQPSSISFSEAAATLPGQWVREIPTPGVPALMIPAVAGVATCANIAADSPPTLMCRYEIFSYSIGWALIFSTVAAESPPPTIQAELALLINGRSRYVTADLEVSSTNPAAPTNSFLASGSWGGSDLVNPITLDARDRLSLRCGINCADALASGPQMFVGVQAVFNGLGTGYVVVPFESSLSYNVVDLPARHRI